MQKTITCSLIQSTLGTYAHSLTTPELLLDAIKPSPIESCRVRSEMTLAADGFLLTRSSSESIVNTGHAHEYMWDANTDQVVNPYYYEISHETGSCRYSEELANEVRAGRIRPMFKANTRRFREKGVMADGTATIRAILNQNKRRGMYGRG